MQHIADHLWMASVTSSITGSTKRRYSCYSESAFEVLHPAGATRCTDRGKIWHGEVVHSAILNVYLHRYKESGTKNLTKSYEISEYKSKTFLRGVYPLRGFT